MSGRRAGGRLDEVEGPLDDGEVAQAEEVHLEQAEVGHAVHLVLGDDGRVGRVAAGLGLALDGQVLGERLPGDDHRGGVDAVLAAQAAQALGHVDDLAWRRGRSRTGPAARPPSCSPPRSRASSSRQAAQGGVAAHDQRRHGLGDAVADGVGVAEHPGRVAHRGPGLDGGEGDDLGHVVGPVALGRVADHLAAVALVEVHVDVGHLPAARR